MANMTDDTNYNREVSLRRRLNELLQTAFQLPVDDYYCSLDIQGLISLKSVLAEINNTLTMRLTLNFIEWVGEALGLDAIAMGNVRNMINSQKPNLNGFDVHYLPAPSFVTEVKCNVPVGGGSKYGAAQKNGIIKDIQSLQSGEKKAAPVDVGTLKFIVFPDLPTVRAANNHLKSSNARISKEFREFRILGENEKPTDPHLVYGVHVNL